MVDRKVVPFYEFYYQLKLTHVFQKHPVFEQLTVTCLHRRVFINASSLLQIDPFPRRVVTPRCVSYESTLSSQEGKHFAQRDYVCMAGRANYFRRAGHYKSVL
jgi:hypothetical protein